MRGLVDQLLDNYIDGIKAAESEVFTDYRRLCAIENRVETMIDGEANPYRIEEQCKRYLKAHRLVMNKLVKNRRWVSESYLEEVYEDIVQLNACMIEAIQSHKPIYQGYGREFVSELIKNEFFFSDHLYRYARYLKSHIENVVCPEVFNENTELQLCA